MAPKLFEGRPASEASDLFAVGVLAYDLFARRHAFDRGDDAELIGSILRTEPDWEPLRKHQALLRWCADCSPRLRRIDRRQRMRCTRCPGRGTASAQGDCSPA